MDVRAAGRAWTRRLGRPLFAAVVFCAAGLTCAVFAIGVNRLVASRPPPSAGAAVPGSSATPSATSAPATPSSGSTSCTGAARASGDLKGLRVAAPAEVSVTDGDTTLQVVVPAGARLDGQLQDLRAHLDGGGPGQPLHGTLVQDVDLCAQGADGLKRIPLQSGAQVDGTVAPASSGVEAQDIHVQQPRGEGD